MYFYAKKGKISSKYQNFNGINFPHSMFFCQCVSNQLMYVFCQCVSSQLIYVFCQCVSSQLIYVFCQCVSSQLIYVFCQYVSNQLKKFYNKNASKSIFQGYHLFFYNVTDWFKKLTSIIFYTANSYSISHLLGTVSKLQFHQSSTRHSDYTVTGQ